MKLQTIYICEQCGFESPKWIGKCPACDAWNSFTEDVKMKGGAVEKRETRGLALSPVSLVHKSEERDRLTTAMEEFDRVLGGGIVEGGVILLSGEPGIGKSTLTLQICGHIASSEKIHKQKKNVLYISGEESHHQIADRAKRLGIDNENIQIVNENVLENILTTLEEHKPGCVIIDSIQVMASVNLPSMSGSINQVRFCTEAFVNFAKKTDTPVIIIGHVTKEGNLAGPRILEHLVDTVLFLEGERYQNLRILRSLKNRFGSTNEIGIFEMAERGLQEIKNASQVFLEGRKIGSFGSAITATIEGTRPLLVEVQALTNISPFGYPKRAGSGFDLNRLQLLVAVIQKHLSLNLSNQDVYVNVAGGLRLDEPAVDLAVIMAIISSFQKIPLPSDTLYLGEVGLSGELRSISQFEKRLQEAERMGFQHVVTPKLSGKISTKKIKITAAEDLGKVMQILKATGNSN